MGELHWCFLGRVDYDEARRMQSSLAEMRAAERIGDLLLLLEHPAILTVGRNAPLPRVAGPGRPAVVRTDRGGDVTYHGPGQLVGYPVCRLAARGRGVRSFVSALEHAICDMALGLGLAVTPRPGLPGAWSGGEGPPRKLASIGLGVRRGVTLHGFAINVDERAERGFDGISPCGMDGVRVTSLASLCGGRPPRLPAVAARVARAVAVRTRHDWVPKALAPSALPIPGARVEGRIDGERSRRHARAFRLG